MNEHESARSSEDLLADLVEAGVIPADRVEQARGIASASAHPSSPTPAETAEQGHLREAAAYIGGYLLFFAVTGSFASSKAFPVLYLALAAVFGVLAARRISAAGGARAVREGGGEQRRTVGMFLLLMTWSMSGASIYLIERTLFEHTSSLHGVLVLVWVSLAALAVWCFRLVPTFMGQLTAASYSATAVGMTLSWVGLSGWTVFGITCLAFGAGWLVIASRGSSRSIVLGQLIGLGVGLLGARVLAHIDSLWWVGALATAGIAALGFKRFLAGMGQVYLIFAMWATLIVEPQVLHRVFGDTFGGEFALYFTAATFLGFAVFRKKIVQKQQAAQQAAELRRDVTVGGPR